MGKRIIIFVILVLASDIILCQQLISPQQTPPPVEHGFYMGIYTSKPWGASFTSPTTAELNWIKKGDGVAGSYEAINTIIPYVSISEDNNDLKFYLGTTDVVDESFLSRCKSRDLRVILNCEIGRIYSHRNSDFTPVLSEADNDLNIFLARLDLILADNNLKSCIYGAYIADEPSQPGAAGENPDSRPTRDNLGGSYTTYLPIVYNAIKAKLQDKSTPGNDIYLAETMESPYLPNYNNYNNYCDILMIDGYGTPAWDRSLMELVHSVVKARKVLPSTMKIIPIIELGNQGGPKFSPGLDYGTQTVKGEWGYVLSHGLLHSAIRKLYKLGVDGIHFYAWHESDESINHNQYAYNRW
jgi:hypothetical protein